jgi:chromosome partitioning protein
MMRKICVINQKGGVAKTTTTISMGAGLSRKGKKVLILDLDAQGSVGICLKSQSTKDMYDFMFNGSDIRECVTHLGENLDLVTSRETLTKAELLLTTEPNKEYVLRNKLKDVKGYDYILIDCSPSLGLLNQNAILACDEAVIPTSTDILGYKALKKMILAIDELSSVFGHDCRVTKIIPTMYDQRLKICKEIYSKISNDYYELVSEPILTCSKLKEAPKEGQSIFKYAPSSSAAKDYMKLVVSIMQDEKDYDRAETSAAKKAAIEA